MKSITAPSFWRRYFELPRAAQIAADKQFQLWKRYPRHPSLRFKKVDARKWSVRVTGSYRALAFVEGDTMVWYWIGPHHEYDELLRRRR